jgi:DedD protein
MAMAEPADINVDELRRRARRRLVGAVVLALAVAVIVPMLFETEQKPLGEDVSVKIPPIDENKFVNRLNDSRPNDAAKTAEPRAADDAAKARAAPQAPPAERSSRYDTRVPEPPATGAAPAASQSPPASTQSVSPPNSPDNAPRQADAAQSVPPAKSPDTAPRQADAAKAVAPAPAAPKAAAAAAAPAPAAGAMAAETKAQSEAKAPPPHEGFAVQLAAFADDRGANALAGRLKRSGYAAYTEPLKTSKGTLWRVRVGPYPSREAAATARDKLKTEGHSGIVAAIK